MNNSLRLIKAILTVRPLRKLIGRKIFLSKIISKMCSETSRLGKPVIIYASNFEFSGPLIQRPHHILRLLAKAGYPVICFDNIKRVRTDVDNLYIFPKNALKALTRNKRLDKILFFSLGTPIRDYKLKNDRVTFYEFIDDFELFFDEEHAIKYKEMFQKITASPNVWTLITANALYEKAIEYGVPEERIIFSKNAVNIDDFSSSRSVVPHSMKSIVAKRKPIIGYYGALTVTWFDFDLMSELVRLHPEWEFVFIGLIYGDPKIEETKKRMADLQKYKNFTWIPPIKYEEIPLYARHFSVATIPFQINEITKGTNPVKLFEYMAMGLPIVTTPMPECKLYKSVFIAESVNDFSFLIENAISLKNDKEYQKILMREASENTWAARVDDMLSIIKKYDSGGASIR